MVDLDWTSVRAAVATVDDAVDDVDIETRKAVEAAKSYVEQALESSSMGLLDALIAAVGTAGELASGLLDSLAEVDDFWGSFVQIIKNNISEGLGGTVEYIVILHRMIFAAINELTPNKDTLTTHLQRAIDSMGVKSKSATDDYIADIMAQPMIIRWLLDLASLIAGAHSILNARIAGQISTIAQGSMSEELPTPLSLAMLTELVKRQDVGLEWAKNHAKRSGVSGDLYDLAQKLERQRLTPDHYITTWLRTKSEAHIDEIRKLGVAEDDIERLLFLAFSEPTPSDLIRFLVRDAYDEEAVGRNKYDEDFDKKYKQDKFDRVGVSKELAQLYWRAHWQLPSPTQGYEMLHRGIIDQTRLLELLKLADYAPGYVNELMAISYNVPGRIDLRRMWEVGIITDRAELVTRYGHLGYNSADAEVLANFSITLAERTKANEAERKRRPIAAQIVRSYVQGTLGRDAAHAAIIGVGFSEEDANSYLAEADYGRERDRTDRIRDSVGRQYVRGSVTEEDARAKLEGYGFLEGEIALAFDSWRLDRELRDWSEAEQHEKDLSRTDIVAAFEGGILTPSDAYASLVALGYDEQEADTLLELSAAKTARADAKAEQDSIRVQYLNRRIDEGEARNRLDAIATPASRRDSLLARWTIEREERAPDMPVSWLERLIFHAEISEDDARSELERRGFSDQEVDWTMRLWGADVSVARERLEQQRTQFQQTLEQRAQQFAQRISVQERALALRDRTATTAQVLQQERFERTLEQRAQLQDERLDAAAAARVQAAATQADRDAAQFARQRELQANGFDAQLQRLERQIRAADERASAARASQQELQSRREALSLQLASIQDARQQRTIEAQDRRLSAQITAANTRAEQAAESRAALQRSQQDFQDRQRQAREAAAEARAISQEASRIRQESRAEASTIRREERGAERRTIEASEAAIQREQLRSLALQRDAAIADLNARLAAIEAEAAEQRIALAEQQQRDAQERLSRLVGPALVFESAV